MPLKNLIFTLLIFSISNFTIAQSSPSKIKEYLSLIGQVNMLCIFVDTDQGEWEQAEIEAYYNKYMKALKWLEEEAEFYDQELYFNDERFFNDNKRVIYIDEITRRDRPSATFRKVLSELGYADFEALTRINGFDFKKNKLKIVLMVKQNSRSHAFNYWSVDDVDMAIVYCRSTIGIPTDEYVIAHEILHQFGAWDLYRGESQTKATFSKAIELFPNSIMINTYKNKSSLEVDELTAWRIGWSDFDESYLYFDPQKNRAKAMEELKERQESRNGKKKTTLKFNLGKKKEN